jgi:hypothetical protein
VACTGASTSKDQLLKELVPETLADKKHRVNVKSGPFITRKTFNRIYTAELIQTFVRISRQLFDRGLRTDSEVVGQYALVGGTTTNLHCSDQRKSQ